MANNVSMIPSAMDLFLVLPRLAQRAGSFALAHMPEGVDSMASHILSGGSMIADATAKETVGSSVITNTSGTFVQSTAAALAGLGDNWTEAGEQGTSSIIMTMAHGIGKLKNFGGIFSYLTSKWALTTFTAAIILNRTSFYASSREPLHLRWYMRAALYMVPLAAFIYQIDVILQTMKCQTSPDFAQHRYGDPLKQLSLDFAGEGGLLYQLSSRLLFWRDDASCCNAMNMSLVGLDDDDDRLRFRGSMSVLYWFFITLCTSQFFETLASALQGRQAMPEVGMTIFEHSLAFAETEAMISSAIGLSFFGPKHPPGISVNKASENIGTIMGRGELLQRLNMPPEVLLVCLISCFSHISSAVLAIFGIRNRVRLVNTGVWALCYMSAFIWSFAKIFSSSADNVTDLGVLRFPTVCIVGFIPHLLILIGILICGLIYGLALLITALSIPSDIARDLTLRQRFSWAYNNLQAKVQFSASSSIRIKMSEDFYTTLLKIGFNVLTAASEAVYLNEGNRVYVADMTWLEKKRIEELAASVESRRRPLMSDEALSEDDGIAKGLGIIDTQHTRDSTKSPYARERKTTASKGDLSSKAESSNADNGLGLAQRRSRMHLTFDFIAGIFWLIVGVQAGLLIRTLRKIGIKRQPSWLIKAAGLSIPSRKPSAEDRPGKNGFKDFYVMDGSGKLVVPQDSNFDVEAEIRQRLRRTGDYPNEQHVADEMYKWWSQGGRLGDIDASGDWETASTMSDDTTSVISMSTNASEESGRRTPTRDDPFGMRTRETTPASDADVSLSSLSRLLNPQTAAEREEARLLSYSLQSERPLTRSAYRRDQERSRAEILKGLRPVPDRNTTRDAEDHDLEQFILDKRAQAQARERRTSTWATGAAGMGADGPQCVVCQSEPRGVLAWPCGCLSVCDDCRIGLAARNTTNCICCRTEMVAYSRLYVP